MLKSLSQSRQSPVSSPRFHYAPGKVSHSTPSSPISRRASKSTPKPTIPLPKPYQYVDAGTQWSPRMNVEKEPAPTEAQEIEPELPALPPTPAVTAGAVPPPTQSVTVPESPSTKRRQSRVASLSANSNNEALPLKRVKSEQDTVKILPARYEFCEIEDMVILIANMISELIQTNDSLPLRTGVLTRFHSRTPPGISVLDYLQRLAKHATLTPPLLLSMVYYIDRLCSLYPAFTINTLTVHRFLITAATVAAKGLSDSFWNNATYARVGGIKLAELGLLELDFLYRVDWKIVPNPEILVDYYRGLVERSDGYEIDDEESTTDEDEDSTEENAEQGGEAPAETEGETTTKWNEWMHDVSAKKAEDGSGKNEERDEERNEERNKGKENKEKIDAKE